jgi:hypothetical protein
MADKPEPDEYIIRPYFTTKNGRRIYARWYGKKGFRIRVTRR